MSSAGGDKGNGGGRESISGVPGGPEAIFVARQPIFDRQGKIWGYELLFRGGATAKEAMFSDSDMATSKVIADGFFLAKPGIDPGAKLLINFPRNLIVEGAAHTLPKDICIVEILETVNPEPAILDALKDLKANGYVLALDDFVGQEGFEDIIRLADIVKVDILGRDPRDISGIVSSLKDHGVKLLAEKIEDPIIHKVCLKFGFDYFQGFYFSKPEIIPGKKLSSSQVAKLQLLRELGKDDFDVREIADIIGRDLSISYRLLRYINSANFSPKIKVESITQALRMLGQRQLSQWLRVVLMADLDAAGKSPAVAMASVQRAKFLELLAQTRALAGQPPESMFLLGLFSMLETLLGMPMREILENVPLDDAVKRALCGEKTPLGNWLKLIEAYERANWDEVDAILKQSDLGPVQASRFYMDALKWTRDTLSPEPSAVDKP